VSAFWQVLFLLLWVFRLLILGRLVIEFVRVFARSWRPVGRPAVAMEVLYVTTDPAIKLFRRLIPPLRLGGVGFDLSVIVLLVLIQIAMWIVAPFMYR
jgi:YggT family protein